MLIGTKVWRLHLQTSSPSEKLSAKCPQWAPLSLHAEVLHGQLLKKLVDRKI